MAHTGTPSALQQLNSFADYLEYLQTTSSWPDVYVSDTLYPVVAIYIVLFLAGILLAWATPRLRSAQHASVKHSAGQPRRIRVTAARVLWAAYLLVAWRLLTLETWNPCTVLALDNMSPLTLDARDLKLVRRAFRILALTSRPDRAVSAQEMLDKRRVGPSVHRAHAFLQTIMGTSSGTRWSVNVPGLWVFRSVRALVSVGVAIRSAVSESVVGDQYASVAVAAAVLVGVLSVWGWYRSHRQAVAV